MSALFTVLASILLLQSAVALLAALRFARYSLRHAHHPQTRYQPKATLIIPCKGLDQDFEENIRAFLVQDYRDYEVIFVTESQSDPAYGVLSKLIKQSRHAAWLVVAGEAKGRGQKVHNLLEAIETLNSIDHRSEVLVFADTDARVTRHWLSELISPLGNKEIGATTGFRWYLPVKGGLASTLLSVWNSAAMSLLGDHSSFVWGGGMAMRRASFEKLEICKRWQGAVSDDYVITAALHEAKQQIKFVPQCLVASQADTSFKGLLEFTTRQIRITRIYAPQVWRLTCLTHGLYNLTVWGGLLWIIICSALHRSNPASLTMLITVLAFGTLAGSVRGMVAGKLLKANYESIQKLWWAYALLGPAVSLIYLYNLVASIVSTRIVWRGIGYELISPAETIILNRTAQPNSKSPGAHSQRQRQSSARSSSKKIR